VLANAGEHVTQVSLRLKAVHFCGAGERIEDMNREGDEDWIHGINMLISEIDEGDDVSDIGRIYRRIVGRPGSFSDYYIHRKDPVERVEANKELDQLRKKLWSKLS
jgi:hypothetical protein